MAAAGSQNAPNIWVYHEEQHFQAFQPRQQMVMLDANGLKYAEDALGGSMAKFQMLMPNGEQQCIVS